MSERPDGPQTFRPLIETSASDKELKGEEGTGERKEERKEERNKFNAQVTTISAFFL